MVIMSRLLQFEETGVIDKEQTYQPMEVTLCQPCSLRQHLQLEELARRMTLNDLANLLHDISLGVVRRQVRSTTFTGPEALPFCLFRRRVEPDVRTSR